MKMYILAILIVSACTALPTPSDAAPAQETETTVSAIQEERAGQTDAPTTTGEKDFLDELFEGVADAVTSGALSPLTDVALKPLVSAVGGSLVEQIFSAANEIINEWKRSKRHNFEAHPVFIPDRGSFILVSADWIIPESPVQDNTEELTTTEKVLEINLIKTTEDNDRTHYINETIVKEPNIIEKPSTNESNSKINEVNATTDTLPSLNNEADKTSLNNLDFNITDDLAPESEGELDINNEIERRSIAEHEHLEIVAPDTSEGAILNDMQTNYRKGRLQRIETNLYWRTGTERMQKSRQAKLLNKDAPNMDMPEVISLKNVYLVPVRGDVDWTRGEEEFEALQEAVKAVMVTRKVAEARQKMVEQLLGDKLRQLGSSLNS